VLRNKDILNWRYYDSRGGNYKIKIVEEDNKIIGYIVLKIEKKKITEGYIVDFIKIKSRNDVIELLLNNAIEYFERNNVNSILYLGMYDEELFSILKKYGFINPRRKMTLFYRPIKDDLISLLNNSKKKQYFSFGDVDYL
jgi:hypothetical protein